MITVKITGITETLQRLQAINALPHSQIMQIVEEASAPLVNKIKDNYIAAGHYKTGSLVNSIEAFRRRRKGKTDPFYTVYVGPRYTSRTSLFSYGGNAAHLLEYGTVNRFRANKKQGGFVGKSGKYGATYSTGRIVRPSIGVIRKSYDEMKPMIIPAMQSKIEFLILERARKRLKAA